MSEHEFVYLLKRHNGIIYKCCHVYCKKLSHPDLAQDIALEAWKSLNNFKKNSKFSTWLYAIARNVCVSALRKQATYPCVEGLEEYAYRLAEVSNAKEMVKQLRNAIKYDAVVANIDPAWQSAFEMYLHGASFKEMEQQTGISENVLRVRMLRIKKQLYLRYGKSEDIK